MSKPIYICGHRNPDTDSICSALAYAELKTKLGFQVQPKRLGAINRETAFVLSHFGVEPPELLTTVRTQISDLSMDIIPPASPDISIQKAWTLMKKNNCKSIPVTDGEGQLLGVVTLSDIANKYLDTLETPILANSRTPLHNIIDTLSATRIETADQPDQPTENFIVTGKAIVGAMSPDALDPYIEPGDIVILGDRQDSQLKSIEKGAACLIITGNHTVSDRVVKLARAKGCALLRTPCDTFTAARLINQSTPIGYVMSQDNLITFDIEDYVDVTKDKMLETRFRSYPVLDGERVKGFISRYHLITSRHKQVILLDHNEKSQTVDGIEQAEILEIIDHHRLGDLQTESPITFKNDTVGSTATIIANLYFEHGISPTTKIAGILCAAILSDTLKFKSPTCTHIDRATARRLAAIASLDIDTFAAAMFASASSLQNRTPQDILAQDLKEFNIDGHKIAVAQINSSDTETLTTLRPNLIAHMEKQAHTQNYELLLLLITDIIEESSECLAVGDKRDLIAQAFNVSPPTDANPTILPGIVSRKKQVIPPLAAALRNK
ncbi:MAG: putative manganese-dependent inorganic diphosphatase [Peptococcaceae bacterium]|nr:putative manganese-dependent inorganic diphosphatase [Peptococcaceae bacterium]